MIKPIDLLKYYASEEFNPVMPRNTKFRHFRFKQSNGRSWRKIPEDIRTSDELKKWIQKLGGVDLYYSISQWLSPERVSAKGISGTYVIADNCILDNDLIFDIDAPDPICLETIDLARKSAWNLYQGMLSYKERYKLEYCAFSGHRGFRLSYIDTKQLPVDPRKRFDYIDQNRKLFITQLLKEIKENAFKRPIYKIATFLDKKITINPLCVVRIIGTGHSSTGFISTKILPSTLRKPIKKILDDIPYIGKGRPGIPVKREMTKEAQNPRPRLYNNLEEDVSGLASLPYYKSTHKYFITNRVLGIKRGFIPIFIYQENQEYYKKEILGLQARFKLGPLYVFQHETNKVVIALKTMQRRQLHRVLNQSTSKTRHDFKKHRRIFAPFFMVLLEKIPYPFTGHLSKAHHIYVEPKGHQTRNVYCGWSKMELVRADLKEENK